MNVPHLKNGESGVWFGDSDINGVDSKSQNFDSAANSVTAVGGKNSSAGKTAGAPSRLRGTTAFHGFSRKPRDVDRWRSRLDGPRVYHVR